MYEGHTQRCQQRPVNGARSSVWPPAGGRMEEERQKEKERERKDGQMIEWFNYSKLFWLRTAIKFFFFFVSKCCCIFLLVRDSRKIALDMIRFAYKQLWRNPIAQTACRQNRSQFVKLTGKMIKQPYLKTIKTNLVIRVT